MARRCSSRFVRVTSSIKRSVEACRSRRICSKSAGNPGGKSVVYGISESTSKDREIESIKVRREISMLMMPSGACWG